MDHRRVLPSEGLRATAGGGMTRSTRSVVGWGAARPAELPLTSAEIDFAAGEWERCEEGERRVRLWAGIRIFAEQLWSSDPSDRASAQLIWTNLAFAVGNFKRQGGVIHPTGDLLTALPAVTAARDSLVVPTGADGDSVTLHRHLDLLSKTVKALKGIRGIGNGVATGSAVLASLWPSDYAIYDRRTRQAAVGLLSLRTGPVGQRAELADPGWSEYPGYLALLHTTMDRCEELCLLTVERALFVMAEYADPDGYETWREYGVAIQGALKCRMSRGTAG